MNIAELWEEIESDQAWREAEIRFFQNRMLKMTSEEEQNRFLRILVLILYAHFEGFCKFAFILYVNAVNNEGINCSNANECRDFSSEVKSIKTDR